MVNVIPEHIYIDDNVISDMLDHVKILLQYRKILKGETKQKLQILIA